jgi:hypothetical protein
MSFFSRLNSNYIFKCTGCGEIINPGEFMCIIAKSPEQSWYGKTETIIHRFVKSILPNVLWSPKQKGVNQT